MMQNRCKTIVVRRCRQRCHTGAPLCPLLAPKVAKWQPNLLQKTSQRRQKAALCTDSFKNCAMCDLHTIYYTLATFTTSVNPHFHLLFVTLTHYFAESFSNPLQEPSRRASFCDFGRHLDAIGPPLVPKRCPKASKMPPKNDLKMRLGTKWCLRGCPGYPHDLKI